MTEKSPYKHTSKDSFEDPEHQHPSLLTCSQCCYLIDVLQKTKPSEVLSHPWMNKQALGLRTQVLSTQTGRLCLRAAPMLWEPQMPGL